MTGTNSSMTWRQRSSSRDQESENGSVLTPRTRSGTVAVKASPRPGIDAASAATRGSGPVGSFVVRLAVKIAEGGRTGRVPVAVTSRPAAWSPTAPGVSGSPPISISALAASAASAVTFPEVGSRTKACRSNSVGTPVPSPRSQNAPVVGSTFVVGTNSPSRATTIST